MAELDNEKMWESMLKHSMEHPQARLAHIIALSLKDQNKRFNDNMEIEEIPLICNFKVGDTIKHKLGNIKYTITQVDDTYIRCAGGGVIGIEAANVYYEIVNNNDENI